MTMRLAMTTIDTLLSGDITKLSAEAAQAGDTSMVDDCALVLDGFLASDACEICAYVDDERGEVRDAARRIVSAINDAEGRA